MVSFRIEDVDTESTNDRNMYITLDNTFKYKSFLAY